jgi:hypothetical protein
VASKHLGEPVKRSVLVAAAMAAALALAACSGDGDESGRPLAEDTAQVPTASQSQTVTSEAAPEDDAAAEYFEKFATNDATQVQQAADLAAEGSFAAGYAQHRANIWNTNLDHGYGAASPSQVDLESAAAVVCQPDAPEECSTFSDFTFRDGKLAGFTVDGVDISGRLVVGDGTIVKSQGVAGFELLSAYQSVRDESLTAVFRFHSYDRPIDTSYVAVYRDPTGRQVQDLESVLPSSLLPNSNQLAVLPFPRAGVGGEFVLKFATGDERDPLIVDEVSVSSRGR